ncbi:PQ-loop repeat-containing protein [Phanerochaete sordida]|uniref:PQ-loop repeat-containing protein n=1 Tax=Phanerochaete sordida TaxID=48140 RepID=A0A9P3G2Y1_9APHY|nr:PQ-loop repeat-containing protein [Phanerochaete sordida]
MALLSSLSDLLGYASIGCWLGAQFPQVLENHRRRSVDGLAWPFLLNWLLGDMSNLVGCILTHQLPFQTYLAIYFCFVDCTLVGQYLYYRHTAKPRPALTTRSRAASAATIGRGEHAPTHYRALSHVAANVAAAAALAAQQEEQARWRPAHSVESRHTVLSAGTGETDDEVDEAALARLADSFHSDGGRSTRKKVSWSRERGGSIGRGAHPPALSPIARPVSAIFPGAPEEDALDRGRPATREVQLDETQHEWAVESSRRRSSRASRKGAGMVFLGAWALFGVGTLVGSRRGLATENAIRIGRVLTNIPTPVPIQSVANRAYSGSANTLDGTLAEETPAPPLDTPISFDNLQFEQPISSTRADDPDDNHDAPSTDYVIGRISAWICTTLYLTSRLPQIWKNYARKSVDGLSISLFVFAFLGNLLYVSSILSSPNLALPEPEAAAFLKESVPYLLGSGGTLMFDITIVIQSFLYKPKSARGRRMSRSMAEEEEGLLATGADDPVTPSRRRMPNSSTTERGE